MSCTQAQQQQQHQEPQQELASDPLESSQTAQHDDDLTSANEARRPQTASLNAGSPRETSAANMGAEGRYPVGSAQLQHHTSGTQAAVTEEVVECVVCWAADACMVFAPCGHLCTCELCAQACLEVASRLCPMCRTPVASSISLKH